MGSTLKRDEIVGGRGSKPGQVSPEALASEAQNRQVAASFLQASTLTDDPTMRESLRRRAAALLERHVMAGECVAC